MVAFNVICADPPWGPRDKLPGRGRGAAKHYKTMTVAEICKFGLPDVSRDAFLFLWRLASMPSEGLAVARAWGFEPKTEIVWRKLTKTGKRHFGMGHYVRGEHETCIIATRGRAKVRNRSTRSVFDAQVPCGVNGRAMHSAKPAAFYDIVEELCEGPFVELFARRQRPGWTCLGDQVSA